MAHKIRRQVARDRPCAHPTIGFAPKNWVRIGFADSPPFDSSQQIGFDLQILFFWRRSLRLAIFGGIRAGLPCFADEFGFLAESQAGHASESTREFGFVS